MSRIQPSCIRYSSKTLNSPYLGHSIYYFKVQLKQNFALMRVSSPLGGVLKWPCKANKRNTLCVLQPGILPLYTQLRSLNYAYRMQALSISWWNNKTLACGLSIFHSGFGPCKSNLNLSSAKGYTTKLADITPISRAWNIFGPHQMLRRMIVAPKSLIQSQRGLYEQKRKQKWPWYYDNHSKSSLNITWKTKLGPGHKRVSYKSSLYDFNHITVMTRAKDSGLDRIQPYCARPLQQGRRNGLASVARKIRPYTRAGHRISSHIKAITHGQPKQSFLKDTCAMTNGKPSEKSEKETFAQRPKLSCLFMLQALHMLTGKRNDSRGSGITPSLHLSQSQNELHRKKHLLYFDFQSVKDAPCEASLICKPSEHLPRATGRKIKNVAKLSMHGGAFTPRGVSPTAPSHQRNVPSLELPLRSNISSPISGAQISLSRAFNQPLSMHLFLGLCGLFAYGKGQTRHIKSIRAQKHHTLSGSGKAYGRRYSKPYALGMRHTVAYQKIGCERLKTAFVFDLKLLLQGHTKSLKPTLSIRL